MVTLVVATTIDPDTIGPASALLAMPGWQPGPNLQEMSSFINKDVRLLKHDNSVVREDLLDKRWQYATGQVVDKVTLEGTHRGPEVNAPTMFVEIGSMEEYWKRQDAAQEVAQVV